MALRTSLPKAAEPSNTLRRAALSARTHVLLPLFKPRNAGRIVCGAEGLAGGEASGRIDRTWDPTAAADAHRVIGSFDEPLQTAPAKQQQQQQQRQQSSQLDAQLPPLEGLGLDPEARPAASAVVGDPTLDPSAAAPAADTPCAAGTCACCRPGGTGEILRVITHVRGVVLEVEDADGNIIYMDEDGEEGEDGGSSGAAESAWRQQQQQQGPLLYVPDVFILPPAAEDAE